MIDHLRDQVFLAALRRQQRMAAQRSRHKRRSNMKAASEALSQNQGTQTRLTRGIPAIRDEYFWAGFLELGYEWWPALALLFGSMLAIASGSTPWKELGIGIIGGLTVLVLTTPFLRWRDNAIKAEIWEAAQALGDHLGIGEDEVLDAVEDLLVDNEEGEEFA